MNQKLIKSLEVMRTSLLERITAYLACGGLFNPEQANHDEVRELLIDCRAFLDASTSSVSETSEPFNSGDLVSAMFRDGNGA